jgi:hypothetical protein
MDANGGKSPKFIDRIGARNLIQASDIRSDRVRNSIRDTVGDNGSGTPIRPFELGIALKPARARKRAGSPSEGLSEDF